MATWGGSTFDPLMFAADRGSHHLSVLRFLRGDFSPLRLITDSPDLDHLSVPLMVIGGGAVWLACWLIVEIFVYGRARKTQPRADAAQSTFF